MNISMGLEGSKPREKEPKRESLGSHSLYMVPRGERENACFRLTKGKIVLEAKVGWFGASSQRANTKHTGAVII